MVVHVFRLPERLRLAREALGLTQRQAARRAGVDPTWLSHLERGRRLGPTQVAISDFGTRLGVDRQTAAELISAARHDRVLRVVQLENPESSQLVSASLLASEVLDAAELSGLAQKVGRLVKSKQQLVRLSSSPEDDCVLVQPGRATDRI